MPRKEIYGLNDDMLTWVTKESNNRYIEELSTSFAKRLDHETLIEISEKVQTELDSLEMISVPKTSMDQIN